jgi:hypothetical protein
MNREHGIDRLFAGVDLGGTSIKVALADSVGKRMLTRSIPTHSHRGATDVVQRIGTLIGELLDQSGMASQQLHGIGIGAPGLVDVPSVPASRAAWHSTESYGWARWARPANSAIKRSFLTGRIVAAGIAVAWRPLQWYRDRRRRSAFDEVRPRSIAARIGRRKRRSRHGP